MGKTSLEESSSSTRAGESSLAAPLLSAGAVRVAAAAPAAAPATASPDSYTAVSTATPTDEDRSSGRPRTLQQKPTGEGRGSSSTCAASAAVRLEPSLMLLPLSLTPAIALDPRVQSIDLFANVKAYDHGQGCCNYLCSRCAPVFDWVSYLHAEALQRPVPVSGSSESANTPASFSLSNGGAAGGEGRAQQSQRRRSTSPFVDTGQVPAGTQATLLTLFGNRQLVFRAVQEVNRAYSNFWRLLLLVLLVLVLFLPGIGLLALLLIGCCSSLRKMCDDAVLQQMRTACEKADQRLATWGVGLLLMEGYPSAALMPTGRQDLEMGLPPAAAAAAYGAPQARNIGPALAGSYSAPDPHAAAALAALSAAASHNSRVWVLRVYMLPRSGDAFTAGAAGAAAVPAIHIPRATSRLLSPSSSPPASSAAPTSDSSFGALPASLPGDTAASRTRSVQQAANTSGENCCMQHEESATAGGTEQSNEKSPSCDDAREVLPQQEGQPKTSLAQPSQEAEALPVAVAISVKDATIAGGEAVICNENGHMAAADVDDAASTAAPTETAAENTQLLQPRANIKTLTQKGSDARKKRRGRKSGTKPSDMREPLLCQEDNLDAV